MRHILSVLVENRTGVLARVAGLFGRRGYNIESLSVGATDNPEISRMTIVVEGDEHVIEQVGKQLNKLVDILKVKDISRDQYVNRELVLFKVNAASDKRSEIMQVVDVFRARIVDYGRKTFIIEATGSPAKIEALREALQPFGIRELARTGEVAMTRGQNFFE